MSEKQTVDLELWRRKVHAVDDAIHAVVAEHAQKGKPAAEKAPQTASNSRPRALKAALPLRS